SIGYSACHWCHVMERESFENKSIADLLNQHFVSIKVDREERPDLDKIYMKAVQMLTGRGGWPMSVFMTPDLRPFYGGTYFPPESRMGMPGFKDIIVQLAQLWEKDKARIQMAAAETTKRLTDTKTSRGKLRRQLAEAATQSLTKSFDKVNGGFGGAPKFPPSGSLELLLREYRRTGETQLLDMVEHTLDRMAVGGLYDLVGGGFHRYTVEETWLVPHFEKMLYDNALLTRVYLDAWLVLGKGRYRQVATETLDFVLREMQDPAGGFHSTLDADSEGEEGKFYVWSRKEIERLLPPDQARATIAHFGVTKKGNFEGHTIFRTENTLEETARELGLEPPLLQAQLHDALKALYKYRETRVHPHKDDKVLTAWNGLMISAMVKGYRVLGDERYLKASERAAAFFLEKMRTPDGDLLRVFRDGRAAGKGFLDDHAFLADALLDLFETTGHLQWLREADAITTAMNQKFGDKDGGFFYTEKGQADLINRERCEMDNAIPSPNAIAARVLIRLARLTDRPRLEQAGERALSSAVPMGIQYPSAFMHTWCAMDLLLTPPRDLVIAGRENAERVLIRTAWKRYDPNLAIIPWDPKGADAAELQKLCPLVEGRRAINGKPAAYLCEARTCRPAVQTSKELEELLP
ncbi:MAG: thioredoxin domain-containing protein, partial [Lentisphaeria bacterium]|nr:thioredoxin domain-containing protein [Lentisphaeria bacterium]